MQPGSYTHGGSHWAHATTDVGDFISRAAALDPAATLMPFQSADWLRAWFGTLAPAKAVEPVLITVREAATGQVAMMLPLALRRLHGLRLVEFADLNISDYNFPIIGPAAPRTREAAAAAWRAAMKAMPPADLVRLSKLPAAVDGRVNPLALLETRRAPNIRNSVALPDTWEAYIGERSANFRQELSRKQRNLEKLGARCVVITDVAQAHHVLEQLNAFQAKRMQELGESYFLDQPAYARFYREIVELGVISRFIVLSAMTSGDTVVAASLGLRLGDTYTLTRQGHIGGEWNRRSPAMVLLGETIKWLISQGVTTYDMGVGPQDYKLRFGCEQEELLSYEHPLSVNGQLAAAAVQRIDRLRESRFGKVLVTQWHRTWRKRASGAENATA